MFSTLQHLIVLLLSVAALVGAIWALVDASKYSDGQYKNAGKNSKGMWLAILGVAALIAFISLPWPLGGGGGIGGLLGIAAIIAVIYYFVDVKPKVSGTSGGGGRPGGW
ncbi:DUF2516 family protein [Demequina sp.]|uniref:DUF2516 family protein n=1 Tax=Demequina sp. TaxID=2050685 RepID=UPI003A843464